MSLQGTFVKHVGPGELDLWKTNFMWFLQKLTFKYGRPLVHKSPGYTCRIKHLLDLFPTAKFVHIHRHPYEVLQSSVHTLKKASPYVALQAHECDVEQSIRNIAKLYDGFFAQRHLIPAENFCEVAFADLETDPMGQMESIYESLSLPEFHPVAPPLQAYLRSIEGYTKNRHPDLPNDIRKRLARDWRQCFEHWDYST